MKNSYSYFHRFIFELPRKLYPKKSPPSSSGTGQAQGRTTGPLLPPPPEVRFRGFWSLYIKISINKYKK